MSLALLVIDVQNDYFHDSGPYLLPDREPALACIHALLTGARAKGVPIFHIVHEQLAPDASYFRTGSEGAAIHSSIEVLPGEVKVLKHFPGSFWQTPLEAYLRRAGADTVIVCGFMTQMCCDTTTRQARERAFKTWFCSDATTARSLTYNGITVSHRQVHETTLAVMSQFGRVATAAEIIADM
ncbi:MAG TPA: cysteine hydrolase family protein [Symbiobacteriaceae bacterium]|nr:cysteine hydrolase family protein [Symbiobacteriaceae bacterium]